MWRKARRVVERIPGAEQAIEVVDATTGIALEGLHTASVERGLNSITPSWVFRTFAAEGVYVSSYDDVRKLDLKFCVTEQYPDAKSVT